MSLESPLGRVRGLGTAKEGTGHFWHQRLTAIALIPLTFLFVVIVFAFIGADHADAVELMGNPLVATVMLLFLIVGFYHMKLGMQVVIEDYISHEGVKIAALLCVTFGGFTLATASIFAVLKLALGG
jgi:succinate dehydrogenase / fumarate reductase membrane anchor subunit